VRIGPTPKSILSLALRLLAAPLVADAQQPGSFHQIGFLVHRSPEASRVAILYAPANLAHAPGLPLRSDEVIE